MNALDLAAHVKQEGGAMHKHLGAVARQPTARLWLAVAAVGLAIAFAGKRPATAQETIKVGVHGETTTQIPRSTFSHSSQSANATTGFGIGLLVGMTGLGGGSPLLILLFGIHPATAVGTDLLYSAATKTAGSVVHGLARSIEWQVVLRLAAGSVPAAVVTVAALSLANQSQAARSLITVVLRFIVDDRRCFDFPQHDCNSTGADFLCWMIVVRPS